MSDTCSEVVPGGESELVSDTCSEVVPGGESELVSDTCSEVVPGGECVRYIPNCFIALGLTLEK